MFDLVRLKDNYALKFLHSIGKTSAAEKRGLRPKKRAADREVCRNRKNGRSIVKKRLTTQGKDYIIAKVKAEAPLLTRRQVRQAR